MGQEKDRLIKQQEEEAATKAEQDNEAREKGYVCSRCGEPIEFELWGLQDQCGYCEHMTTKDD
jgi:hypothetical protein